MLETKKVSKSFGGLKAVNACSVRIEENSITGLVGPNGAGKTTLFNVITGFLKRDEGEIWLNDEEVGSLPPNEIALKGMVRTFQTAAGFANMTVMENMMIATPSQGKENVWNNLLNHKKIQLAERESVEKAGEILNFIGLYEKRDEYVQDLSGAEVKLLEVARQMMTDAKLFLLDEPMSGVLPAFQEKMVTYIRDIRDRLGLAFFIIEHNLAFMREVSDVVYVMNSGEVLSHGTWQQITSDEKVIAAYLGGKR
jgi:ABC-type branched-subunit amino acid transport system ATPase component